MLGLHCLVRAGVINIDDNTSWLVVYWTLVINQLLIDRLSSLFIHPPSHNNHWLKRRQSSLYASWSIVIIFFIRLFHDDSVLLFNGLRELLAKSKRHPILRGEHFMFLFNDWELVISHYVLCRFMFFWSYRRILFFFKLFWSLRWRRRKLARIYFEHHWQFLCGLFIKSGFFILISSRFNQTFILINIIIAIFFHRNFFFFINRFSFPLLNFLLNIIF